MSTTVQTLIAEALALSLEDRADLVERLLASLEPPILSTSWQAEVDRRIADMGGDPVRLLSADDVYAKVDRILLQTRA